jgi:hypothetical protein
MLDMPYFIAGKTLAAGSCAVALRVAGGCVACVGICGCEFWRRACGLGCGGRGIEAVASAGE